MQLLLDPGTKPWESRLCLRFEAGTPLLVQDLGLYNNNKELMTEDDFEKTSLETGEKAMEKLMKPVEATLEGRGVRWGGHLEPFVLLEPPARNPGCCVIGLTYSCGTLSNFSCLRLVAKPLDPLDPLCTPPGTPGIYS